jgi:regulator of sirC expression with transglutaminase-like and TPR domain
LITRADIVEQINRARETDDHAFNISELAVLVGALDRPALPVERYQRHFANLAEKVGKYARDDAGPVPADEMADALKQILNRNYGYGPGDHTSDVDCYDLTRVVDSRAGSSETLAMLYVETARRLDWTCEALQVPGRLLIRLESLGERVIVDPLGDGQPMEPADIRAIIKAFGGNEAEMTPGSLEPLSDLELLLRMFAAKKALLLRGKRIEDAADVIDTALMLAPSDPTLWRERGLINARLDRIRDAIDALEEYLRLGKGDEGRYHTTILLQELRGRLT